MSGRVKMCRWIRGSALDITNLQSVAEVILKHQPDAVVHTAAYTDVDGCERDPNKAYLLNTQGTWNVAAVCGGA